jgi:ABC-type dipeptide/oligopeptide/nickel transport system ATPase component
MADRLLEVKDLSTHFFTYAGVVRAVNGVSFTLDHDETIGIVGESGSGKTVTALSIMRLVPDPPGKVVAGSIEFKGHDLLALKDDEMRAVRGNDIAMIFQDPMTSLNPVLKIGGQIAEAIQLHQGKSKKEAWRLTVELLDQVGIADAQKRVKQYPFELSGGMCQRVMIAMAISCNPDILIADEPTTALDVTVQAQVLELLRELQQKHGLAMLFISHDLAVVGQVASRVAVMRDGQLVEEGPSARLLTAPEQAYTRGLLAAVPTLRTDRSMPLARIPGLETA